MNYWEEAFIAALEEADVAIPSNDKLKLAVDVISSAHENYGMAYGHDCIPNPENTEIAGLKRQIKVLEAKVQTERDNFVKNICMRRNVEPHQVHLTGNGHAEVFP